MCIVAALMPHWECTVLLQLPVNGRGKDNHSESQNERAHPVVL
jgi:hypothetical protein